MATTDLEAADARISALEAERERLEDELEDAGIALLLHDRLASAGEERVGAEAFLRAIGLDEFVDELPSDWGRSTRPSLAPLSGHRSSSARTPSASRA